MKTTVNIKMDEKDKKEAKELFESLGLDMTTAVNLFIKAALRTRSIPFPIYEERTDTNSFIKSIESDIETSEKQIEEGNVITHAEVTKGLSDKYGLDI